MKFPPSTHFNHCLLLLTAVVTFLSFPSRAASPNDNWDSAFGVPGLDSGGVTTIAVDGTRVYLGGLFNSVASVATANIASWDGKDWGNLDGGANGIVYALISTAQGGVIAGGGFSAVGATQANNIAHWSGTNWSTFGSGLNAIVFALACDEQNLYVGGHFTTAGGIQASKVAKWNGTNWFPLGSGIIPVSQPDGTVGAVDSLTVHGNDVYVGGRFRNAGGIAATNIARWDGTNGHALGNGLRYFNGPGSENGAVRVLRVHGGFLYAGGEFRRAGDMDANFIARWDGTNWFSIGSAANAVSALVPNGNDLYVGGGFVNIGGVSARVVAKWDGQSWSALGSGISGGAISGGLACNGTELFVGGTFTTAGGKPANNIALWHIPHALSVNCADQTVTLSWPATGTNLVLEGKADVADTNWNVVSTNHTIVGDQCRVAQPINSPARFFRLRRK